VAFAFRNKKYAVLSEKSQWYEIKYENISGWIRKEKARLYKKERAFQAADRVPATSRPPDVSPGVGGDSITVTKKFVPIHRQPDTASKPIAFALEGKRYPVLSVRENFYEVKYDNLIGWIHRKNVRQPVSKTETPVAEIVLRTVQIGANDATVFGRASTESTPLAIAQHGKHYPVIDELPEWYRVVVDTDTGWVQQRQCAGYTPEEHEDPVDSFSITLTKSLQEGSDTRSRLSHRRRSTRHFSGVERTSSDNDDHYFKSLPDLRASTSPGDSDIVIPVDDSMQLFVQLTDTLVPFFPSRNNAQPPLFSARKGELFKLVAYGSKWYRIDLGSDSAWVERTAVSLLQLTESPRQEALPVTTYVLIGVITLLLFVAVVSMLYTFGSVFKIAPAISRRRSSQRHCLILANRPKIIKSNLFNEELTLDTCFSRIGFQTRQIYDLDHVKNVLRHYHPDVILVDWLFSKDIYSTIHSLLGSLRNEIQGSIIFYNIPYNHRIKKQYRIPGAFYLGTQCNDRQIFQCVSRRHSAGPHEESVAMSVEAHALEGSLAEGTLSDVLQFLEIGKKTGRLSVEKSKRDGRIEVENGIIVFAATDTADGTDAVFELLDLTKGIFRFTAGEASKERNCTSPIVSLLLLWAQKKDERKRR
jgi:hypothetical protein